MFGSAHLCSEPDLETSRTGKEKECNAMEILRRNFIQDDGWKKALSPKSNKTTIEYRVTNSAFNYLCLALTCILCAVILLPFTAIQVIARDVIFIQVRSVEVLIC